MSALIGALRVTLGLDSAAFEKGASAIEKRSQKLSRSIEGYGKSMTSLGQTLSLAVTLPLVAFGKTAVEAAMQSKDALASVEVTLKSMGTAAGHTSDQLQEMAGGMMRKSLYDDDDILRQVTTTMLTFGKVTGDTFDRGQQAAIDLAAKFNMQLQPAAMMLGKALNDPVKGMTALTKAGVSFTTQQKDQVKAMVKAGDVAGAQKLILTELENQVRGSAEAARKANPFAALKQEFADFQETVGGVLLTILPNVTNALERLLQAFANLPPGVQQFVVIGGVLAAALGPILAAIGPLVSAFAPFLAILGTAAAEGGVLVAAQAGFAGLAAVLGPILVPLAAVAAAGYVLYENWDKIAPVLLEFWEALKKAVGPEIQNLITTIKSTLTDLWNGPLGSMVRTGVALLGDFAVAYIKAFGPVAIAAIKLVVQTVTNLFATIGDGVRMVKAIFEGDWRTALTSALSVFNRLFGGLPEYVAGIGQRIGTAIRVWVLDKLNAIWDQVTAKIETVKRAFYNLYDAVVGHSYIPDMVDGIAAQMDRLDGAMVDKAKVASKKTGDAFKALAAEVQPILDRLFPEVAKLRQYRDETAKIAELGKSDKKSDPAFIAEAQRRLRLEQYGLPFERDGVDVTTGIDTAKLQSQVEKMSGFAWLAKDKIEAANVRIVQSFKEMADGALAAFDRVAQSLRGGGFLDILGSVIGFGLQLGSMGLFGKGVASSINKVPAHANGTNFAPGGLSLVGERGPELVNLRRGSQVIPNHALGGTTRLEIVPSPYFDTRVDGRVAMAGPLIADAGSRMGVARVKQAGNWALR